MFDICVFAAVRLELIGLAVVKWTSEGEKQLPIDLDDKVKGSCTKENYFYYKTSFIEKGKVVLVYR